MRVETKVEGEQFVYRHLWQVVVRQCQHRPANLYDHLVAMVFAFHTLEAYLNFIGVRLRSTFVDPPYLSFEKKLREVMQRLDLAEPDRSVRPYRTIWDLKGLRDEIAHGKHVQFLRVFEHDASEEPRMAGGFLDARVTKRGAVRAVQDVRRFIRFIHEAAKVKRPDDVTLRQAPLGGILDMAVTTHSMRAAPD